MIPKVDAMASIHFDWTTALAEDLDAAQFDVHVSTLSFNHPSGSATNKLTIAIRALQSAAARGVLVHVYMPAPSPSHPATLQNGSAADRLHAKNIHVHLQPLPGLLHMKAIVIDDAVTWVGSANWTQAAATHNLEAYARLESVPLSQQTRAKMQSLCWKRSKQARAIL